MLTAPKGSQHLVKSDQVGDHLGLRTPELRCLEAKDAKGGAHRALEIQALHVLPVLLQQGHQKVDRQLQTKIENHPL